MILMIGAILGFVSVAFGAYAEHGLRDNLTEEHFRYLMTAIRYNQIYAVLICAIGLSFLSSGRLANMISAKISVFLYVIGTVLFSFSIYLSVTFDVPSLLNITPFGGITIMAAWLLLAWSGFQYWKRQ